MVIIIMGSRSDKEHRDKIAKHLLAFGISYEILYASAHKTPQYLLDCIETLERKYVKEARAYITIAGLSNGLSGMVDAAVQVPVIACPPIDTGNAFAPYDIFSSLHMPSGVAPAVVLNPLNAALLTAKILGKHKEVKEFQTRQREKLMSGIKGQLELYYNREAK